MGSIRERRYCYSALPSENTPAMSQIIRSKYHESLRARYIFHASLVKFSPFVTGGEWR